MNTKEIKKLIRQKYVRPGEYGISLSRATERLSVAIARQEYRQIVWDHIHDASTGWHIEVRFWIATPAK